MNINICRDFLNNCINKRRLYKFDGKDPRIISAEDLKTKENSPNGSYYMIFTILESTGNGNKDTILQNIKLCKEANIDVGLNTVVQNADVQKYERIILFAIENELPLKLLPQIGNRDSYKYKDFIIPILNRYSVDFKDKKSGALKWSLKKDGHFTSVLYIDSPCFYSDIKTCRNFAELRIHPNLAAQTCILKDSTIKLQFNQGFQLVKNQLQELWNNFTIC